MFKLIDLLNVLDRNDYVTIRNSSSGIEFRGLLDDMYWDIIEDKDIHDMGVVSISSNGYDLEYEICTTIIIE